MKIFFEKCLISLLMIFITTFTHSPPLRSEVKNQNIEILSGIYFDKKSGQYFVNNQAQFSLRSARKNQFLDKILLSVDNSDFSPFSGKLNFDKEGFHLIRFKAIDPVLNWSPVETFRIYVDLRPPHIHHFWKGDTYFKDSNLYIGRSTSLNLQSFDNLSGVKSIKWKLVGHNQVYPYKSDMKFKNSGEKALQVITEDNVGNISNSEVIKFILDENPPNPVASVKGNSFKVKDRLYLDRGSFITIDAKDDLSGIKNIQYRVNKGEISTFNERIVLIDQKTFFEYRAIDNVGNTSEWKSMEVYLDTTYPQILTQITGDYQKISGKYYARPGLSIIVNATDSESGMKNLIVDNENVLESSSKKFTFNNPKEYAFSVKAIDRVGNVSDTKEFIIVIDNTPPVAKLESERILKKQGEVFLSSLPNRLYFTADDTQVGVKYIQYSYDKKDIVKFEGYIDLSTWQTPKRDLYFRAIDYLGNASAWNQQTIYVLKKGPDVDLYVETSKLPAVPLSKLKEMNIKGAPNRNLSGEKSKSKSRSKSTINKKIKKSKSVKSSSRSNIKKKKSFKRKKK